MNYEGLKWMENAYKNIHDIPRTHMEGLEKQLENLSKLDASLEVGKKYFEEEVQGSAGLLGPFRELSKDGGKEQFAKHYSDYLNRPESMKKENPDMYQFMKDRVFYGREYSQMPNSQKISFTGSKMNFMPEEYGDSKRSSIKTGKLT